MKVVIMFDTVKVSASLAVSLLDSRSFALTSVVLLAMHSSLVQQSFFQTKKSELIKLAV